MITKRKSTFRLPPARSRTVYSRPGATTVLFVLFSVLSGCNSPTTPNAENAENTATPPNIIWLMAEDISTDLGCYGFPDVRTPNLDALAAAGVRFENAFVTNPICSPSRSAMMIGAHQVKTNTHHHRSNREVPLSAPYVPFTQLLREAGYTTVLGHHGVRGRGRKTDVNFRHQPIGPWDGKTQFGLFDKFDTLTADDQPFFAQIQLNTTHRGDWWEEVSSQSADRHDPAAITLPVYMADDPVVRKDWARYLDQLEYMDGEVGMIRRELSEKGIADNTIIIFIGDNGRCNIRGKGYLHDPGLHIPLIIYDPRVSEAGSQVRSEVVSATDITASILQYAGAELPSFLTGQPLQSEDFNREYVYAARDLWDEINEKSRAIVSKKWKYIRNDLPDIPYDAHQAYLEFYRPAVHAMRKLQAAGQLTPAQALFFQPNKPTEELYDLANDPDELNNLATQPEYAERLDQFRRLAQEYDQRMSPVSDTYHPVHAGAVDILNHIRKHQPELHRRMLAGEEIGFKKSSLLYKEHQKAKEGR